MDFEQIISCYLIQELFIQFPVFVFLPFLTIIINRLLLFVFVFFSLTYGL